jgi:hypothetical protein
MAWRKASRALHHFSDFIPSPLGPSKKTIGTKIPPESSTIKNRIQLYRDGENKVDKEPAKIIKKEIPLRNGTGREFPPGVADGRFALEE